jgi:hypothetical protein
MSVRFQEKPVSIRFSFSARSCRKKVSLLFLDLESFVKQSQFDCIFADLEQGLRVKRWNGLKEAIEMVPGFRLENENELMIFFAHVSHESDGLKTLEEYCGKDGSCADRYQGGFDTWCTQIQAAEGKKYFGRGWFQLSWPCKSANEKSSF